MYSDQIVYTTAPTIVQANSNTAHSRAVHVREMSHLNNEIMVEGKRMNKETELAFQDSARANKEFAKAAKKGHGRRARRHELKGDRFAAAADTHQMNAFESQAEIDRARTLSSLPPRGTLPTAQLMNATTVSTVQSVPTVVSNTYITPATVANDIGPMSSLPIYSSMNI